MHGSGDDTKKPSKEDLRLAAAYHRRRLSEMAQYERSLAEIVFSTRRLNDKHPEADQRLLEKPLAYQTLVTLWVASPYIQGSQSWVGWECRDTVYRLAGVFARPDASGKPNKRAKGALIQYIHRVVDAAERYELVSSQIAPDDTGRILLRATSLLHELMTHQALCQSRVTVEQDHG